MSKRKIQLAVDEFYHIFNRGVEKRVIFTDQREMNRFLQSMQEFNTLQPIGSIYANSYRLRSEAPKRTKRLVDIVCYCLNANHYHFVLKQIAEKGIEKFMHKLSTGYTNYFNAKHKRSGVLFQGPFKAVHIKSNEQLLHTSVYVNLNFKVHQLRSEAPKSVSSWEEYVGNSKANHCQKGDILTQFNNKKEYQRYAERTLPSILERKEILKELEDQAT